MTKRINGGRRGNPAALPPAVNKMLKEGRLTDLAAYASKVYGLALDPVTMDPAAMKQALTGAAKARAAAKAQAQAQQEAVQRQQQAQTGVQQLAQPAPTADAVKAATEAARKAEIAALPKDPWTESGRKPGKVLQVSGVYNEDGVMLMPDTSPVLSDQEYLAELRATDARFVTALDEDTMKAMEKMPEHLRPKPVKPPFRHPTRPCIPKAFFNQQTGVYFRPTEMLMRNPNLTPVYQNPPVDAVYGT